MKIKINKDNLIKILISLDIIVIVVILELMFLEKIPEQEENKVKVAIQSTNEKENNILDNQINNILIENIVLEDTKEENTNTVNNTKETKEDTKDNNKAKSKNNNTKTTNLNKTNSNNISSTTTKPKDENKTENEEEKEEIEDEKEEDSTAVDDGNYYQTESKTMFSNLNKFRKENDRKALSYSSSLEKYAKIRAKEIAKNFSHTRPGRRNYLRCFFRLW